MAWSYTRATGQGGWSEAATSSGDAVWCSFQFGWTATQVASPNTSTIRVQIKVTSTGWNCAPSYYTFYLTDTVVCNNTTYTIKARRDIAYDNARNYTYNLDLPLACAGKSITFKILGKENSTTLGAKAPYTLTTTADTGSTITVTRTTAQVGSTGTVTSGSMIYYGDVLQISFTASSTYAIETHTVNGSTFASGGTHTVKGNVAVIATSAKVMSTISATNANIGSSTTITVNQYNSSYTHTITYSFPDQSGNEGDATGQIGNAKRSDTSISWTVPTSFYSRIPNAKTGTCTLTCTTFDGNTNRGQSTCTFKVTASESACAPTVSGTVVDVNDSSITLTGNSSNLVKNLSTARCTITSTAKNSASISQNKVNDTVILSSGYTDITEVDTGSFVFSATDSRGYSKTATVTKTLVDYVPVTINPEIERATAIGTSMKMRFDGSFFNGSFGAYTNNLSVRYRYRVSTDSDWGSWTTVSSSNYTFSSGNKYGTTSDITLSQSFDKDLSYVFQVNARDIAKADGQSNITVHSVTKTITVSIGMPVFDWGKNDFQFNVPVLCNVDDLSGTNSIYTASGTGDGAGYQIIGTNVDVSEAAGTQKVAKRFRIWCKNQTHILADMIGLRLADGRTGMRLQTHRAGTTNGAVYNNVSLYIDDQGTRTVTVSDPAAWRTGLGLGNAATLNLADMYVVSNIVADNISVSSNSFTGNLTVSCTKSGYTAMGILNPYILNATTSGVNGIYTEVVYAYIDGSLIRYMLRTHINEPASKVKVTFPVLWRKNT